MDNSYQALQLFQYLYISIRDTINRAIQQGHEFGLTLPEITQEINTNYAAYFHGQITEHDISKVLTHEVNGVPLFETATRTMDHVVFWKPAQTQNRPVSQAQPTAGGFQNPQQRAYSQMDLIYLQQQQQQQQKQQQTRDLEPIGQTAEELEMEIAELNKRLIPLKRQNEQLKKYMQLLHNPHLIQEKQDKILESTVLSMRDAHIMVTQKIENIIKFIDEEIETPQS